MRGPLFSFVAPALLSVAGCTLPVTGLVAVDAGMDAGPPDTDAGEVDAGPPGVDAGPRMDAGDTDAGFDAGIDAGPGCDPTACPGRRCEGGECSAHPSCDALHAAAPDLPSGVYPLADEARLYDAYCEMSEDGGGWTLVLKADGTTDELPFDSALWTDTNLLRATSLDLTPDDAKLEAYLYVPFEELRIGFVDSSDVTRWLLARRDDGVAPSMQRAMMQSGTPNLVRPDGSPLTRGDWTGLLPGSSTRLQLGCGRSAMPNPGGGGCFMVCANVRIGILGNNGGNCSTPDSYMGIGGFPSDHPDADPTGAIDSAGNGIGARAFVLVR